MTHRVPSRETLVANARAGWEADDVTRERVARAVEARAALHARRGRLWVRGGWVAVVLTIAGAFWVGTANRSTRHVAMQKQVHRHDVQDNVVARPSPSSGEPTVIPRAEDAPPAPAVATRTSRKSDSPMAEVAPAVEGPTPNLPTDEVAIIRAADQALRANEFELSRTLLARHEREFPNGALAEEREGLRVIERCLSRQSPLGATLALDFVASHPRSPLRDRVRRACGESSLSPGTNGR